MVLLLPEPEPEPELDMAKKEGGRGKTRTEKGKHKAQKAGKSKLPLCVRVVTERVSVLFGWLQFLVPGEGRGLCTVNSVSCVLRVVFFCVLCSLVSKRADERDMLCCVVCLSLHSFKSVSLCTTFFFFL